MCLQMKVPAVQQEILKAALEDQEIMEILDSQTDLVRCLCQCTQMCRCIVICEEMPSLLDVDHDVNCMLAYSTFTCFWCTAVDTLFAAGDGLAGDDVSWHAVHPCLTYPIHMHGTQASANSHHHTHVHRRASTWFDLGLLPRGY